MRRLIRSKASFVVAVVSLAGCNASAPDPERYVLTGSDKKVIFSEQLAIDPRRADEVIAAVKKFSADHDMDFLLARKTLPIGDFNVSANAPGINIKAMHTAAVGDKGVQIFAIVPKSPTPGDKALVADFVNRLNVLSEAKTQ